MCTNIRRHFKEATPKSIITWSEMERQNIQAKKVYLVMTLTHDMVLLTLPYHTLNNVGLQIIGKMILLFSIVLGRGGGKVEFFPFKLLLEVFLNNFFKIAAFSNIPCALQKHTIEGIKRICGSPRTGGVTITSL